jgi:tripartite-type tricarboxylate transporter receptor subunit TctC
MNFPKQCIKRALSSSVLSSSVLPSLLLSSVALSSISMCSIAHAQAWPSRPIKVVVPYGPGSSPDVLMRLVGEGLGQRLGQPVLIENRAGAGGNVGTGFVAKAPADGYTYVISTNGPLVYNTVLYKKLPYDPFKELTPVVLAGGQANVCAVRSDAGINNLQELVGAMRKNPGKFNFSSTGIGSLSHLGIELLKAKTNTFAVHIPYPSSPTAVTSILQGDVQFACVPGVAVMPQVKAGRLKALAVSTEKRSALMPDIATMKESGFPEVVAVAWMAILAPTGTAPEIIGRMNREINAVLQTPEIREKLHNQYMEPIGGSPEQLAKFMQDELRIWTPIIQRSGATVD